MDYQEIVQLRDAGLLSERAFEEIVSDMQARREETEADIRAAYNQVMDDRQMDIWAKAHDRAYGTNVSGLRRQIQMQVQQASLRGRLGGSR